MQTTWVAAFLLFLLAFDVALGELVHFCALIALFEGRVGLKMNSFARCYSLAIWPSPMTKFPQPLWALASVWPSTGYIFHFWLLTRIARLAACFPSLVPSLWEEAAAAFSEPSAQALQPRVRSSSHCARCAEERNGKSGERWLPSSWRLFCSLGRQRWATLKRFWRCFQRVRRKNPWDVGRSAVQMVSGKITFWKWQFWIFSVCFLLLLRGFVISRSRLRWI